MECGDYDLAHALHMYANTTQRPCHVSQADDVWGRYQAGVKEFAFTPARIKVRHAAAATRPARDCGVAQMIWKRMLEAVDFIHSQRVIHSDLKPANFLFVKGELKLIDFGIARSMNSDTTNIQVHA